jgi:hypothetical protein
MKPQNIGRALGIGLRVAGRMVGQRMAAGPQTTASQPGPSAAPLRSAGQAAAKTSRGVVRGLGGFLRPFGRVGGILWLEVTGVFFLLFVLVFSLAAWRTRPAHLYGPYDKAFVASAALMLLFLYLGVSSFLRAGRR